MYCLCLALFQCLHYCFTFVQLVPCPNISTYLSIMFCYYSFKFVWFITKHTTVFSCSGRFLTRKRPAFLRTRGDASFLSGSLHIITYVCVHMIHMHYVHTNTSQAMSSLCANTECVHLCWPLHLTPHNEILSLPLITALINKQNENVAIRFNRTHDCVYECVCFTASAARVAHEQLSNATLCHTAAN